MPQRLGVRLDRSAGHRDRFAVQPSLLRRMVGPRNKCQGKRSKPGVSEILLARSEIGGEECEQVPQISPFPEKRHLLKKVHFAFVYVWASSEQEMKHHRFK